MHRSLFAPLLASALAVAPVLPAAAAQIDDLVSALQLPAVFAVISEEGQAYGREIDGSMLDAAGGETWRDAVRQIYAPERILPEFTGALEANLAQSKTDIGPAIAFFRSDFGKQATALEISARRALLDPDVEDASRLTLEEMRAEENPRIGLIDAFVEANDLVETNVSSGLNANYAFYNGLRDAGAIGTEMTEDDVVAEVWSQEDAIRQETDTWVHAYLTMAYAPLSDDQIRQYIAVSGEPGAQALNRAMSDAYETVFSDISRQLGRAAGAVLAGQDL